MVKIYFVGVMIMASVVTTGVHAENRLDGYLADYMLSSENRAFAQSTATGYINWVANKTNIDEAARAALNGCRNSEARYRTNRSTCRLVLVNDEYVNQPSYNIVMPSRITITDAISGNESVLEGEVIINDFYERDFSGELHAGGRHLCNFAGRWNARGYRINAACLDYSSNADFSGDNANWVFSFNESTIAVEPYF